jgi:hypothetical protein
MARDPGVEIFIDLPNYIEEFTDTFARYIGGQVVKNARSNVAIDTSALHNSIRLDELGENNYMAVAEMPYALAQEYGRPDLANYTFTPYMRPAAIQATDQGTLNKGVRLAELAAKVKASV